jgi:hypothetical protein
MRVMWWYLGKSGVAHPNLLLFKKFGLVHKVWASNVTW